MSFHSIIASTTLRILAVGAAIAFLSSPSPAAPPTRLPQPLADDVDDAAPLSPNDFRHLADAPPIFSAGGIEVANERYPNGKIKIERQVTLDDAGNYINHGYWKMLNPTGDVVAEGQFEMGDRAGPWMRWHGPKDSTLLQQAPYKHFQAPFRSSVNFVNNEMEGEWLVVDSAQRKVLQISLSGGKRNGVCTTWQPNGTIYQQSTYENGVPVGDLLEFDRKTGEAKRVATYVDGRRLTTKTANARTVNSRTAAKRKKSEEQLLEATTVMQSPDDFWTLRLAEYKIEGESLRHGPSKIWFDNGQLQQDGYYLNGKRSGTFTFYYENGQVAATGEYKNDLPEDVWVWWHRNGQKATVGQYRAGQLAGQWRWWDETGALASQQTYDGTQDAATSPLDDNETAKAPSVDQIY